jgi:hypothetical protein
MAHFAELDENNIVVRVVVVPDEQEHRGQDYLATDVGLGGTWVQTSYNARIRKNYAGVGHLFDEARDAFISPKPFESWLLDESTCQWSPPVARPTDGKTYIWNEETLSWDSYTVLMEASE